VISAFGYDTTDFPGGETLFFRTYNITAALSTIGALIGELAKIKTILVEY
jgi:hypothetical protein